MRALLFLIPTFALLLPGCDDFHECAPLPAQRQAALPSLLSQTGLFAEIATNRIADDALPYAPRTALWSDGAEKRRWLRLPAGASIDSSDMDGWRFPVGTQLFKEFTRDGVRVETRLLQRVGTDDADWAAVAYIWNADGSDAVATPAGMQNARGTQHDVPPASDCMGCHAGTASRVLGVSAVQLPEHGEGGAVGMEELVAKGRLTRPPTQAIHLPGNALQQQALGYLQANCSHCHNQARPTRADDAPRCFDPEREFDFSLRTGDLGSLDTVGVYRTAMGLFGAFEKGNADGSQALSLMKEGVMPALGHETVDAANLAMLRRWIDAETP